MAYPTVTNTFTAGNTSSASQMNQNFTDIINGISDGTKDINVSALTAAGKATLNGDVDLGNATGDTITVNGLFAGTGGYASATQMGLVNTTAQSFAGVKTFDTGIKLATSSGTATTLDYYEEGSFSLNFNTGIFTTTTASTCYFVRVGKNITLTITGILKSSDTTTNYFATGADVPARLRPVQSAWIGTAVYESSNFLGGFCWVSDGGLITVQKYDRSNFAATGNGFPGITISYRIG